MGSSLGNADSPSLSSQQLPCSSSPSPVFKGQLSAPRLPDLAALRLFGHDLGISHHYVVLSSRLEIVFSGEKRELIRLKKLRNLQD